MFSGIVRSIYKKQPEIPAAAGKSGQDSSGWRGLADPGQIFKRAFFVLAATQT